MTDIFKKYKWYLLGGGLLVVTCTFLILINHLSSNEKESEWTVSAKEEQTETVEVEVEKEGETEEESVMDKMLVDVKGAVRSPGVYEVVDEDRVIDVIKKAGGLKEGADELRINFAQKVSDQMVLYIPLLGEEGISMPVFTNDSGLESTEEKTININTANLEELQNLPGVGPSKAEAIISYREDTGLFKNPEDLKLVTGIGEKTFDKLKELIRVK